MIFVTVGGQMPFDRMVRAVDEWAALHARSDVFAQIGSGDWRPTTIAWSSFLAPREFQQKMAEASVVVAHAGMGSILRALELGKPIIVMPRRGDLHETRNDHQFATAKRFRELGFVSVALDERELVAHLDAIEKLQATQRISDQASPALLQTVGQFISQSQPSQQAQRKFDGIICFGEADWWHHDRRHSDMQLMTAFSAELPVLYVNSPASLSHSTKSGSIFLKGLLRAAHSRLRPFRVIGQNLAVLSARTPPGQDNSNTLQNKLARKVTRAARRMHICSPLIWVASPTALPAIHHISHVALVYQRTRHCKTSLEANAHRANDFDRELKERADLTLYSSAELHDAEKAECRFPFYCDIGIAPHPSSKTTPDEPDDAESLAKGTPCQTWKDRARTILTQLEASAITPWQSTGEVG